MNRTTLVALFRSESFKRTASHESFVYESNHMNHLFMNRTTLVVLFGSESFKRTGSHESFVYESDYTGRAVSV